MDQLRVLIRQADLTRYVGLKRTQINELIAAGQFPRPIKLSDSGRAKAWLECEVLAWQNDRIARRQGGAAGSEREGDIDAEVAG